MKKQRDDLVYIKHIRDAINKITGYAAKHSPDDFRHNEWDQDATVRNLEIIGEAANNLGQDFRDQHSEIPWREIIDFRNVAAHGYADLDIDIVWQIISSDLPKLDQQVESILVKNDTIPAS